MEKNTLENGKIIQGMDKELLPTNLAKNMKENLHKGYTMEKEPTHFLTEDSILGHG